MDTAALRMAVRLRHSYEEAVERLTDRHAQHVKAGNEDGAEGATHLVDYMRAEIVDLTSLIDDLLDAGDRA